MWMLCGFGIMVKGKRANRSEAPILVSAPHSTFFDAMVVYMGQISSPLVRVEEQRFGSKSYVHVKRHINLNFNCNLCAFCS